MTNVGESPRDGEHAKAAGRLDDARRDEDQESDRYDAARGTPGELSAQADLREASEQVAAREGWVKWVERDY